MITAIVKRSIIITVIAGISLIGAIIYATVVAIPNMSRLRQDIDDRRATITVREQEQSNIEVLSKNIESIKSEQETLNGHIWPFAVEEQFFDLWTKLEADHSVNISAPKVAEVTPNNQPINRAVTVVMTGQINRVLAAINAIQKIDPLVVIDKVGIKNGIVGQVIATIDAQTVWQ